MADHGRSGFGIGHAVGRPLAQLAVLRTRVATASKAEELQ